ncbi:MAG: hypothetical protein IPL46_24535 [Saprospiraceae bacterium]|nr:hypothetical protein [Saprospiraceae bacterium]
MKFIMNFLILTLLLFTSCDKEETARYDYLIFGSFHGFCHGENCIRIYKLEAGRLFEDNKDEYPSREEFYQGDFHLMDQGEVDLVQSLLKDFPDKLLNEEKSQFGCADCADQGGLYLEIKMGSVRKFWIIDQFKSDVPAYLHAYMDEINAKIELLSKE